MLFRSFPLLSPRHSHQTSLPPVFPIPLAGLFCALFKGAFLALASHPVVEDLTSVLENCLDLDREFYSKTIRNGPTFRFRGQGSSSLTCCQQLPEAQEASLLYPSVCTFTSTRDRATKCNVGDIIWILIWTNIFKFEVIGEANTNRRLMIIRDFFFSVAVMWGFFKSSSFRNTYWNTYRWDDISEICFKIKQ